MNGTNTFIMIKPDATKRGLGSEIIKIFSDAGFTEKAFFYRYLEREEAESLYAEHKDKPHFKDLVDYTISYKVAGTWFEREDAVAYARNMIGEANPAKRRPGCLRDRYAIDYRQNSIHGSDSDEAASNEILLFFGRII